MERWRAWVDAGRPDLDSPRYIGVDVARSGADSTIFAHRHGAAITHIDAYSREDTMQTTARIQAVTGTGPVDGQWATRPVVDSVGVGGGVVDRLRELGVPVLAYTGAAKAYARTRDGEWGFTNTRGAAYWRLRELLDPAFGADIMLPEDDLLTADLTAPTWDVTTGVPPRIKVEPKDDVAARLGRSPDRGDAVAMAYWAENLAATRLSAPCPTGPGVRRLPPGWGGRSEGEERARGVHEAGACVGPGRGLRTHADGERAVQHEPALPKRVRPGLRESGTIAGGSLRFTWRALANTPRLALAGPRRENVVRSRVARRQPKSHPRSNPCRTDRATG